MGNRIAILLSVLLVAAAVTGAFLVLAGRSEPDPLAEATAVVDGYLAAWERFDTNVMQRFVRRDDGRLPEGFVARHARMRDALEPDQTTITREDIELENGQAEIALDVALTLPYAGTWSYETSLTVTRIRGEWAVDWDPQVLHPQLRDDLSFAVVRRAVERAPILDREGEPLTGPGEVHVIGFEPRAVRDEDELLATFEEVLPEARDDLEEELSRDDLVPHWFYPVATLADARFEEVWSALRAEPGVLERSEPGRVSQGDGFALHVLGTTAEVGADQLEELGPPYEEGDVVGQYGLEAELEHELTGGTEVEIVLRDEAEDAVEVLHSHQDDPSSPVRTTLDSRIQQAAENSLVGTSERRTAVVAVDAETGAIRAAASRPLSGENRALVSAYAPGSTFKLVTGAALLADGLPPDAEVSCPEQATVGGLRIGNADDLALGATTLTQAFADSCNTTFAPLAAELGADALVEMAGRFGFRPTEGGLRQEQAAYDLPLTAYAGTFPPPRDTAELGAAAFGQARVEATPLHMATVAAAAADGTWRPPFLVDGEQDDSTAQDLPDGVAADLQAMMRRVVTDGSAADAGLPDDVAGKTGSAEFGDGEETHAWFIGFRDELAFAVLIEGGGSGGSDAAPVAARFLRELDGLSD